MHATANTSNVNYCSHVSLLNVQPAPCTVQLGPRIKLAATSKWGKPQISSCWSTYFIQLCQLLETIVHLQDMPGVLAMVQSLPTQELLLDHILFFNIPSQSQHPL